MLVAIFYLSQTTAIEKLQLRRGDMFSNQPSLIFTFVFVQITGKIEMSMLAKSPLRKTPGNWIVIMSLVFYDHTSRAFPISLTALL